MNPQEVTEQVVRSAAVERLARLGYAVHGLIYVLIGGLATLLALGGHGRLTGLTGAVQTIRDQPLGHIASSITAAGLAAYALWRIVQAITDPDAQGRTWKGMIVRVGRMISGVSYGMLAIFAAKLATDAVTEPAQDGPRSLAYRILTEPIGASIAVLVGLIIFGVAADDVRKACTAEFGERFKITRMSAMQRLWSRCAGRWGFAARSVILCFAGAFVIRSVIFANPGEVRGLEGILQALLALPHGRWVLAAVALGLTSYGCFMLSVARHRRHPY